MPAINQIEQSFYVTGGTLSPDASSYVERSADRQLLSSLLAGEYCYVLNSRQMGKSSLSVRTVSRLRENGVRTAFVDLTRIGAQNVSPEQWYAGLLAETGRALGLRSEFLKHWKEHAQLPPVQRYFGAIREVALPALDSPLVVFVDEIDAVRSLSFSADEFFAAMRACHNARTEDTEYKRLTFCLVGAAAPADLITDIRMSPFNIGRRIELRDFTAQEAECLGQGMGASGAALLRRVLHWTGGHPYLTQRLCRTCVEQGIESERGIDRSCRELFLTHTAQESDDNLSFVRNRLLRSEADLASVLDLYRKMRAGRGVPDDETNPLMSVMKLSGISTVEAGRLRIRNRIYAHVFDQAWVVSHMPGAELRRQKSAYRRGMLRAGAVMGMISILVGALALTAYRSSLAANLARDNARAAAVRETNQRRIADDRLYVAEVNLAEKALESGNVGLARELLDRQRAEPPKRDLRDFAWRYLWGQCRNGELFSYLGHRKPVHALAISPDGKLIASGGEDNLVHLMDVRSHRVERILHGAASTINSLAFSPNGGQILAGGPDGLRTWSVATGKSLARAIGQSECAALSRDGSLAASGAKDGTVRLYNAVTLTPVASFHAHTQDVTAVVFSQDSRQLVSTSHDGKLLVWRIRDLQCVHELKEHHGWTMDASFSPDGRFLASAATDSKVVLWDARSWRKVAVFKGDRSSVNSVSFSGDGALLASGGEDGSIRVWNVVDKTQERVLRGHSDWVNRVRFTPAGTLVASASQDGSVRIWDEGIETDAAPIGPQFTWISAARFSPNGRYCAIMAVGLGTPVVICERASGREVARLAHSALGWRPGCFAFFSNGRMAAVGDGKVIRLWNWQTGQIQKLTMDREVTCLAISPDDSSIAAGTEGGAVVLCDVATRRSERLPLQQTVNVNALAFSPNGRLLACGSEGSDVFIWDPARRTRVARLSGHTRPVEGLAFSPNGGQLASSGNDFTVRLWDTHSWNPVISLRGHLGSVWSVAFSPDGSTLASGGFDGLVILWNLAIMRQVTALPNRFGPVDTIAFSPDGQDLLTAGAEFTRLWHAPLLTEADKPIDQSSDRGAKSARPGGGTGSAIRADLRPGQPQ